MARRSSKKSGEGQYAPLFYALLLSDAWLDLSGAAVKVFLLLHTRYNGSNNGRLRLSFAEAAGQLSLGKATVQRAFRDFQDKGLVVLMKEGNWYHRQAHEWRITTKPVQTPRGRETPTHDWRSYRRENLERGSGTGQSGARVVPFGNRSAASGSISRPVRPVSKGRHGSGSEH
ncbi:helix-turn-helix domain-containing protein [Marinovum sp.]|uniref:helix-turn-helix domain-containing protein n=1 Tax=Marinovum sp. TaxID=2024839 RepID=UPI002B276F6F|nr:helix-turn-helix domain-containing protein [Marinovum sp.]